MTIGLIGGGNMARSLIGGLLRNGLSPEGITVADPSPATRAALERDFGIGTDATNERVARAAETIILAVKPQTLPAVAAGIAGTLAGRAALVISIAAGVGTEALGKWLGTRTIVRTMPNTPALVSAGMTALYAGAWVQAPERARAETIMKAVGETVWVGQESLLDAVTAVSGSGPAYFFLLMEALEQAAVAAGLDPALARTLVRQTALGSAVMATAQDPATLRQQVTSPQGTTERALGVLEAAGVRTALARAVTAAADRSRELSELYR